LCGQAKEEIAVAVVDMMMPMMDGASTIRALKKMKPKMRLIAISGLLQPEKIREEIQTEGVVLLAKPFSAEKLAETLYQVCRGDVATKGEAE
jgi:CheY-like chemotaxis protein